jgi:prepilin-type N-terminal cleavage/methylation domain-containing protein
LFINVKKEILKMKLKKLGAIIRCQLGVTLIELLVGIAISGLLVGGVTIAISQVLSGSTTSSSHMMAIKQLENAIDTIRPDVIEAQDTPDSGSSPFTLSRFSWSDRTEYTITYYLQGNNLIREESINHGAVTSKVVASYIDEFSWVKDSTGKITITIATTYNNLRSSTETRTFDVFPRPAS